MADATVGVQQAATPDRLIDNESLSIGGQTVYRQRVQDPEVIALVEAVRALLAATLTVGGTVGVSNFPATQPVSGTVTATGPLTDTQLRATPVPVSGTVAISNPTTNPETGLAKDATLTGRTQKSQITNGTVDAAVQNSAPAGTEQALVVRPIPSGTQAVSGTFWQTTQPVSAASLPLPSGAATEASLGTDGTSPPAVLGSGTGVRGWLRSIYEKLTGSIAVTGTFWQATQPVSGTVTATGPLTDTQLRATPVPVSGTVTATPSGTQAVSGTFWQATQPVSATFLTNQVGTHVGVAGTLTSGTATGSGRCIGIRLFASGGDASCTVTGITGTITIRSGTGVDLNLLGTVTAPVVTWVSGTIDYLISGLT